MLKIWGRTTSSNVRKALWCLEELELPFERTDAGGPFGVVDTPEYLAMNPNGLVPSIDDDGLILWESNAIVRYLWARHGQPLPSAEHAAADRWMDWTLGMVIPQFVPVFYNLVRAPAGQRDEAAIGRALPQLTRLLAIADAALARAPFLSGKRFGIGDFPLGAIIHIWFNLPIGRPTLPYLQAWYERLLARPAYRKHVVVPVA